MKRLALILIIIAFACPAYADGEDQIVVELVNKALEIFKIQGKEQALKVCGASVGPLRKAHSMCLRLISKVGSQPILFSRIYEAKTPGYFKTRKESLLHKNSLSLQKTGDKGGASIGGSE